MVTFKQTIINLSADIRRRKQLEGKPAGLFSTLCILFKGGVVSVILYRLSRYLIHTRCGFLHKLLALINQLYSKNEISPEAVLGPGLVLADGGGVGITQVAIAGKNCTFLGFNALTLGAMEGFDVHLQRIVIGDHCVIGFGVRMMRPVEIASGTQIKSNAVVMFSVDKVGSVLSGIPAKRRSVESYENVVAWNPLNGGVIIQKTK